MFLPNLFHTTVRISEFKILGATVPHGVGHGSAEQGVHQLCRYEAPPLYTQAFTYVNSGDFKVLT